MTAAVETMAWAGNKVPWHGLGVQVSDNMTPEAMLKAAGLDWTVSKRPIYHKVNGKFEAVPEQYALVRDSDNSFFDVVGKTWKPVQNAEAMDFFKKFVTKANMSLETAGALWGGKIVWVLARLKKDFALKIGKSNDKVQQYVLLASPHVFGKAFLAMHTVVRVVCYNTLMAALGGSWSEAGNRPGTFRMPHSTTFDDRAKQAAEEALGLAVKQSEEFQEIAHLLVKKKAEPKKVEEYFFDVLKFDPKKAPKKKDGQPREPLMLPKLRTALLAAPGQQLPTAEGTWWGALNAVTYVIDHDFGSDPDTGLKNAWFAHKAGIKRRAFDLAVEYAK